MNSKYFIENYTDYLFKYVANGAPSEDTKYNYKLAIDQYIKWFKKHNINILKAKESDVLNYRSHLLNLGMKATSINAKLTCVKRFYYVAIKYEVCDKDPASGINAPRTPEANLTLVKYLTQEQLVKLLRSFDESQEDDFRTKCIVMLMGIEGLRTIEVHRLNVEDIDFNLETILIRGKGHNDFVYPTKRTLKYLRSYINSRRAIKNGRQTPVFTSMSNNNTYGRITRCAIRNSIDKALEKCGFKSETVSCHMLRHTCATLLYRETLDLQVVKNVLRHRSIEMSSRYAHIQDAMLRRYTNAIAIDD